MIAQITNWAFVFKATLGHIQNCNAKRLKQLKIFAAIKNITLQIEATIAKKQTELDCIYLQCIKKTSLKEKTLICFLQNQAQKTQKLVNIKNK